MLDKLNARIRVIDEQLADGTITEFKRTSLQSLRKETEAAIRDLGGTVESRSFAGTAAVETKIAELEARVANLEVRVAAFEGCDVSPALHNEETLADVLS